MQEKTMQQISRELNSAGIDMNVRYLMVGTMVADAVLPSHTKEISVHFSWLEPVDIFIVDKIEIRVIGQIIPASELMQEIVYAQLYQSLAELSVRNLLMAKVPFYKDRDGRCLADPPVWLIMPGNTDHRLKINLPSTADFTSSISFNIILTGFVVYGAFTKI